MEINNNKYQVFIYGCPAHVPVSFASHSWVVVNRKGLISRWEILFQINRDKSFGHLHKDAQRPFQGISIFPFLKGFFWKGERIGYIEGDSGSIAEQVANFIEQSKESYPYLNSYSLSGPNSNTYTEWILNKFPEFKLKLTSDFVGKDYNKII